MPNWVQVTAKTDSLSSGQVRRTTYTYAHSNYSGMKVAHMISQPYKVMLENSSNEILRIDWTLWKDYLISGNYTWHPCAKYIGGPDFGNGKPTGSGGCN